MYADYADGEVHTVEVDNPITFRANLYKYAHKHGLKAKAFVTDTKCVFRLGTEDEDLPNRPKRGRPKNG